MGRGDRIFGWVSGNQFPKKWVSKLIQFGFFSFYYLKNNFSQNILKNPYTQYLGFFGYPHFNTSQRRGCQKWHGMLTVEGAWIKYLWEISCKKKVWGCTYVLNLGWYHFFSPENLSKFGIKLFKQGPFYTSYFSPN